LLTCLAIKYVQSNLLNVHFVMRPQEVENIP